MKFDINVVTRMQENCSIVWCEKSKQAAIIDPGGESERLQKRIAQLGVTITKILLTHAHFDHIGAVKELAETYQVQIYGPHKEDAFLLDNLSEQCAMFGVPLVPSFQVDHWLEEGEQISIGSIDFDILHCPGHTPGHIVFIDKNSKIAFVGDVIFRQSIGRTDFPRGNHSDLIRSIKSKLLPLGDDITFIPGHGPISTLGYERVNNPYLI